MATQSVFVWDESFKAAADLSTHQYKFAKLSAVDTVNLASAATDRCLGVLQNKPAANQAGAVRILGMSFVVSDGSGTAIAAGDYVGPNASSVAVKKATADFNVAGIALDPSTAVGTIIRVLLLPGAFFRTAAG